MNNVLQIFENENFGSVRTLVDNQNEIWFVGKDVVEVLGYDLSGRNVAGTYINKFVDEDDFINYTKESDFCFKSEFDYRVLGQRGGYLINESGLYSLTLSSKLPSAKAFKRWVTKEVLPQIRKTGSYSINPTPTESYMIDDPIDRAKAWIREYEEKLALENTVKEQAPKVKVYNNFIDKEHTLGFRELRHELESTYNMSIKESDLKKFLRKNGLIGKSNKMTALAYGTRNGYVVVKDAMCESGHTVTQVRFTMKTRDLVSNHIETKLAEIKSRIN